MNTLISIACLLFVAVNLMAGQQVNLAPLPALRRTEVRDNHGQYALSYETKDGTIFNEQGTLKQGPNGVGTVLVKQGSYTYISPDGTPIKLSYIADDLGFRPQGAHLPQPVQPLPVF